MAFKVNFRQNSASFSLTMQGGSGQLPLGFSSVQKYNDFILKTDKTLTYEDGILSVNTADAATEDDARPITSQGVYNEFAVIHALLKTI